MASDSTDPYRTVDQVAAFRDFVRTPKARPSVRIMALVVCTTIVAVWCTWEAAADGYKDMVMAPLSLVPAGLLILDGARRQWVKARRLRTALCRPIRAWRSGGRVTIRGRVLQGPGGLIAAPSGLGHGVWARLEAISEGSDSNTTLLDVTATRDFLVDDGSGEQAHIVADHATVDVERCGIDTRSPELQAFLVSHLGKRRPGRVDEYVLQPGDEVIVSGLSRRVDIGRAGKCASAVSQVVLAAGRGQPLLVSAWSLLPPHGGLGFQFVLGVLMAAAGVGAPLLMLLARR